MTGQGDGWERLDLYREGEEVVVIGDHPHRGCTGIVGKYDPNSAPVQRGMLLVEFESGCRHRSGGCYARPHNLQRLP